MKNIDRDTRNKRIRKTVIIAGWLLIWELISIQVGNDVLLVGPLTAGIRLLSDLQTLQFWQTVGCSLLRIIIGFTAGAATGLLLAWISARVSLIEEMISPVLTLIKAVPVASFVVLFLIWWRSSMLSVAISFLIVLPHIYIGTLEGIKSADPRLLEMADVFGMHRLDRFFYIYRPAWKPFLDSSLKLAVGMCWKSGVAAEVIGTPDFSIGERLYLSKIYLDTAGVLSWTVVTILMSVLFERAVFALWEAFCTWEPACHEAAVVRHAGSGDRNAPMLLRVSKVSKRYQGQQVLQQVSAVYERDCCYYFRTPSGSGKTTYFRLLAGLEEPQEGRIEYQNNKSVGMVFQEDRLCEAYSAVRNVAMITGDEEKAKECLRPLLEEEAWNKPCSQLSGGMKRRAAIARAFASQADVILLDEPFGGLDQENRQKVTSYIMERQKGRAILIATHI